MYAAQGGGFFTWNNVSLKDYLIVFVLQNILAYQEFQFPAENMTV